jgi:hypothetical protein
MRIVNLAICDDNIDPKGLGRIRYKIYADNTAYKEKAFDYEPWSDRDLFIASPFLPTNINYVPEIGQSVKIIAYDTDTPTVNPEYIAGPFSTMFDYHSQTFSQQIEDTSFGTAVKRRGNIITPDGKFRDPKSEGAFAKSGDYGIYGPYGSDIVFTEDGLQLRGGKLVSKASASTQNREKMLTTPMMAKKSSRIYLKKFSNKMTLESSENVRTNTESKILNTIIEYSVDDLSTPTEVKLYVYKVNSHPHDTTLYNTNNFTTYTDLVMSGLTLLNLNNNTGTTPTVTVSLTGTTNTLKASYQEIRHLLQVMHEDGLKGIDPLYQIKDLHPFYFRPTSELRERTGNETNKNTILDNITVRRIGPGNGLVWSQSEPNPPQTTTKEKVTKTKIDPNSSEQSFGSIISDKLYFLSTDTNEPGGSIHFDELDKYELTQPDYIQKIEPNTYSVVRGENLLNLLSAIIDVLQSHRHNINDPYARQDYPQHNRLMELFKKMEEEILNKSIRIN